LYFAFKIIAAMIFVLSNDSLPLFLYNFSPPYLFVKVVSNLILFLKLKK